MAHEKVYGFCENKCKVPVAPKTETDAMKEKLDGISLNSSGDIVGNINGFSTGVFVNAIYSKSLVNGYGALYARGAADVQTISANTSAKYDYATSSEITVENFVVDDSLVFPLKLAPGLYLTDQTYITNEFPLSSRSVTCKLTADPSVGYFKSEYTHGAVYKNGTVVLELNADTQNGSFNVNAGDILYCKAKYSTITVTVNADSNVVYLVAD